MWTATNTGTFAVAYNDGSFSASGSFDSTGNFGEMGTERNGRFAEAGEDSQADIASPREENPLAAGGVERTTKPALFKGRVPLRTLSHSAEQN